MNQFRSWLIAQIADTRYGRTPLADDEALSQLAQEMGVQPDVLVEARVRAKTLGRSRWNRQGQRKRLLVNCPEEPFRAWQKHVASWGGISDSDLLRSLIYAYLCGTYEPPRERLTRYWVWDGRHLRVDRKGSKGNPELCVQTLVKYGAFLALLERARKLNHTMTALLRALMLENMDGRFGQRGALTIIDLRSMPGDPEFYLKGR